MKKRFKTLAITTMLLVTTTFSAGAFTAVSSTPDSVIAASKQVDIKREGKKERSIIKGKKFELEVDKPDSIKDKSLSWTIKDSSIVAFAGKERHDDDIDFKAKKVGSTTITCKNKDSGKKVTFKITVKKAPKITKTSTSAGITAIGSKNRNVKVNHELELEVKKEKGIKDSQLKWSIADSKILGFEDPEDGVYDDEMEFIGKKAGKTKVTCTNTKNKKSVVFTVTVK